MAVFIGAIKNENADLNKLSTQELSVLKSKLFSKGLKQFPNSPIQNKTWAKIKKVNTEINKRKN